MDSNINVEEIMAEIKREIKEKGLTEDMLSFEDVPYRKTPQAGSSVQEAMSFLNSAYTLTPYKEIKGSPIKVFIKKVLRKMMKFYIEPLAEEQTNINSQIVTALNCLSETPNDELVKRLETLELSQKELLLRINSLERENEKLRSALGKQENV